MRYSIPCSNLAMVNVSACVLRDYWTVLTVSRSSMGDLSQQNMSVVSRTKVLAAVSIEQVVLKRIHKIKQGGQGQGLQAIL